MEEFERVESNDGVVLRDVLRNERIDDGRRWLGEMPTSSLLDVYQVHHLGKYVVESPFRVTRPHLSGLFFLSCRVGEGEVLIDGKWEKLEEGKACILPPLSMNALRKREGDRWEFDYVRYYQSEVQPSPVSCSQPVISAFDGDPFSHAIAGVLAERCGGNRERFVGMWLQLTDQLVKEFAMPWKSDTRLQRLWSEVGARLDADWNLGELSRSAGLSTEQTRRLCIEGYGRSPMKQLTWLRVQKAIELILTTGAKLEAIAYKVGYKDASTFTNAFKRVTGLPPSRFQEGV